MSSEIKRKANAVLLRIQYSIKINRWRKLEELVETKPYYTLAQYFLGVLYERKGVVEKAIQQYKKVLDIEYDDTLIRARLNSLYF